MRKPGQQAWRPCGRGNPGTLTDLEELRRLVSHFTVAPKACCGIGRGIGKADPRA